MKAYKIELLVLDFDQLGSDEIKSVLEYSCYPNDCISPSAMRVTEADIGPWSDDSPLNSGKTREAEYARIFPAQAQPAAANGWISVLEQLPEKYTEVLVWPAPTDYCQTAERDDKGFYYGEYLQNYGHTNERLSDHHVTHWQPLPSPPQ